MVHMQAYTTCTKFQFRIALTTKSPLEKFFVSVWVKNVFMAYTEFGYQLSKRARFILFSFISGITRITTGIYMEKQFSLYQLH